MNYFDEESGRNLTVTYEISPYRPEVRYLSNGDPGYPAEGGEIEGLSVMDEQGNDITGEISDELYKEIELAIIEGDNSEEDYDQDYPEHYDGLEESIIRKKIKGILLEMIGKK